jgi:hypothetical protein
MGANAQTSVPTFTAGDVLTAANMNISAATGIPVFATTTTRDAAFGGTGEKTLAEGQACYIEAAPKRLQVYNGTAWIDFDAAYTAFTPTWTNLTIGNGTQSFRYARLGKFVHVVGQITFGSTSSMSTAPYFNNPVASNLTANTVTGWTYLLDSGAGNSLGVTIEGGGVQVFVALNTAGTYIANVNITATVPWTWAVNDQLLCNLMYEAS